MTVIDYEAYVRLRDARYNEWALKADKLLAEHQRRTAHIIDEDWNATAYESENQAYDYESERLRQELRADLQLLRMWAQVEE